MKEVLLMIGKGVKQNFQNTDFVSLEASLCVSHIAQRQSSRQPDGAMDLKKKKRKEKPKTKPSNHPKSVFSQTKGETEGWYGLQ